ncbi:DNA-processing protein DprA [Ammoniphilus sp. CFH 90114]|uniref:DNA-processing protein DprA n=1 Tax=Ammoniphilus sp. CFH 90114 TaxID=2493665 RepID=UPI0013E98DA8|nr:DNA-processing protein DprA [Ammoniphilus sp. CFH 90114]
MQQKQIQLLTIQDPLYPGEFTVIPKAPLVFYYRGCLKENSVGVGIVGTTRCTEYGKRVAVHAAETFAQHHIPVISGLDKGIQAYAHTACVNANGYSVAVVGGGVDAKQTKEVQVLIEKILDKGALLSSHPPGTPVHPHHVYQRNFLLSLWSSKLLVIEAGEKSSVLNTVEQARKINREIWAVPHQIYSSEGIGTNQLLAQGASLFLDPRPMISSHFMSSCTPISIPAPAMPVPNLVTESCSSFTFLERDIIENLRFAPLSIDELAKQLRKQHAEIIETVSLLELEGVVRIKLNQWVELVS